MFDVWQNVLAEIEQNIPREAFSTWFTGVSLLSIEEVREIPKLVEWGLSKSEIARTLKVPLGTIKSIFKGHTWFNIGINFKEMNVRRKNRWEEDKKLPVKYLEYLKELKSKYRANYLCNSK